VTDSVGAVHAPKLLGTYELELHPAIEELVRAPIDVVVNIGAGEGYYAVGLARRLPQIHVIAFEADARGRQLLSEMAALNAVAGRIEIRGFCTSADLQAVLPASGHPLVVIDAEGAEETLLDAAAVPALARAVILAEIHDFVRPLDHIRPRFGLTHTCDVIDSRVRTARDLPALIRPFVFTPWRKRVLQAMEEGRPGPMRWFLFRPLARR
jgi:hypothetical protein